MNFTKDELLSEIASLKKESEESIIVVEGKNDKKALINIGINRERIITLSTPLYKVCEIIEKDNDSCIILTDIDKKGKELYSKINSNLSQRGVRINNKFRIFLYKTTLRQIEGLDNYIKRQFK